MSEPLSEHDKEVLDDLLKRSKSEAPEGLKNVDLRQTWDDDCEQVILLHPLPAPAPAHPHHNRLAIVKKSAKSITLEPMMHHPPSGQAFLFNEKVTYVRTADTDTHGRAIFRQGVPSS
jgi:hypothetical protein